MTGRMVSAWCTAAALLLLPASWASAVSKVGAQASGPKVVWFQTLQMTSATSGWATLWSGNPAAVADDPYTLLARTTDGARTWTNVTPAAARSMLTAHHLYQEVVLDPVNGDDAYMAVSDAQLENGGPSMTAVFVTADGGRTWAESGVFMTSSPAVGLSFDNASQGWLLVGPTFRKSGQPVTWLYRTSDGGLHWSPAATVTPPGNYGINSSCQPDNLTFLSATTGWVSITCRVRGELLVSYDGGGSWAAQPLPLPAGTSGLPGGPGLIGPQFAGGTGFLTVEPPPPGTPSLLDSQDRGQSWQRLTLPSGAGQYPQITFFNSADGVLVSLQHSGGFAAVFYATVDGGRSWRPIRQGSHFTRFGEAIEFATQQAGFVWISGGLVARPDVSPPPLYATVNSGRTWHAFVPHLVAGAH